MLQSVTKSAININTHNFTSKGYNRNFTTIIFVLLLLLLKHHLCRAPVYRGTPKKGRVPSKCIHTVPLSFSFIYFSFDKVALAFMRLALSFIDNLYYIAYIRTIFGPPVLHHSSLESSTYLILHCILRKPTIEKLFKSWMQRQILLIHF
jgi:hypothetical protein